MLKHLKIIVCACLHFILISAQSQNTVLLPKILSDKEIEGVLNEIENMDSKYDPEVHLVLSIQSKHYHSDVLEDTRVHSVLQSLNYAVALLDSRKMEFRTKAFDLLNAVIALQDQNPESKTCGVWPYTLEEPLVTKKSPADCNWADFCAVPLISIMINHNEILPTDLKEKARKSLLLAAEAIRKRDVRPDYTNISLMGLYVCYITADMYSNSELMVYARKRLKAFYDCTVLNNGFIEYNSPAYFKLSLDEVLRLKEHVINKEDRFMLDSIYNTGWGIVARHYHKPSAQWAGPHGRCYSVLLNHSAYSWFFSASNGQIAPNTSVPYPKNLNPLLKHQIPSYLIKNFTEPKFPRLETDTFIRAGQDIELNPLVSYQERDKGVMIKTKEIIGKSYFTNEFVLSSANQSSLWNQRRPLIAYWGTEQNPTYMQVRFLHNMYDYASANIFCAQDSTNVLGAINFTTNGGDRHVTIDVIKNATIVASDLRLRFEFGGNVENLKFESFDSQKRLVSGTSGKLNFRVEFPYVLFNDSVGYMKVGGDGKIKWIDLVIYSGFDREFNFEKISDAVLTFLVTLKNDSIGSISEVKVKKDASQVHLLWGNLFVKALSKPYSERATLVLK